MELLMLIVGLLAAAWFLGFVRSISTIADTANTEVAAYNAIHKISTIEKLAALELDSDAITKAQAIVKAAKDLKL